MASVRGSRRTQGSRTLREGADTMNPQVSRNVQAPLPAEAYAKYRGKWIALSADGTRVIAGADDLDTLENQLAAAGEDPENVLFDHVEDEDISLGGAELL